MIIKIFRYILYILALMTFTSLMVKWQFSPYVFFIKDFKKNISIIDHSSIVNTEELTPETKNFKHHDFGSLIDLKNTKISESIQLNNFKFDWGRIDSKKLQRVAAAELRGNYIWYINQDNEELIRRLGLEGKITSNGGIKSIFSLSNKSYAYVTYVENDCATARVVDLTSMKEVLQLPCLPNSENADLNGAGGGWLKLSENTILLAIGTPTNANTDHEINQTAQSDQSLWGKILKLNLVDEKVIVEIFRKGHRNPQGLTQIGKSILAVEQGPMGGDEINIIKKGLNYGWPLQSLGSEYDLEPINKSYSKPIVTEPPLLSFVHSIAGSDINKCPQMYIDYYAPNDCVAVSSLRGKSIDFIVYKNNKVLFSEKMQFKTRLRKFFVSGNTIVAVTDFKGVIIGNLKKIL